MRFKVYRPIADSGEMEFEIEFEAATLKAAKAKATQLAKPNFTWNLAIDGSNGLNGVWKESKQRNQWFKKVRGSDGDPLYLERIVNSLI